MHDQAGRFHWRRGQGLFRKLVKVHASVVIDVGVVT